MLAKRDSSDGELGHGIAGGGRIGDNTLKLRHLGAPLGMADIAEVRWRDVLKFNPLMVKDM